MAERPRRLPRGESLGPRQRTQLVGEIVATYLRACRELRQAPIERAVERLREAEAPAAPIGAHEHEEAQRLGRIVVRVLAYLPGDTRCLRRSLVLTAMLARRGIDARLVIGTRTAPEFLAHAWVEHGGSPVLSIEDGSFGRLVEL